MEDAGIKPEGKDSTLLAAIPYILGLVVGILIYLIAKEDKYARYHALQSVVFGLAFSVVFGAIAIVGFVIYIPIFLATFGLANFVVIPLFLLFGLGTFVLNLYFAYSAYQGKAFMLPYLGKFTKEHLE